MCTKALRTGLCVLLMSVLCAAVSGQDGDRESGPSITEMEQAAAAGAVDSSQEVQRAVEDATARLEQGDPYGAKAVLMRLVRFTELRDADYALIAPVVEQVDAALGEDREKVEAQIAAQLQEEEHWTAFMEELALQKELNRRQARALAEQARIELYVENRPERAEPLARQALALDPENEEADKILTEALAQQGQLPAELKLIQETLGERARVRLQTMWQEYAAAKAKAERLYAEGKFQLALEEWRRAQTYINVLAAYVDVQAESEVVNRQVELAEAAAERQRRSEEEARAAEAREFREDAMRRIDREEAEREAETLDLIYQLIREKRFDEANRLIKELKYKDPGSEGARVVDEVASHEEHEFEMGELVWTTEKETRALIRKTYEQAIPYASYVSYPDKRTWKEVIEARPGVRYPTELVTRTPEELEVMGHLDRRVTLSFDQTPLTEVVEFLQEVTPVNFAIQRQDIPPDQAPITLHIDTSLRNALDLICELAGLAWKVQGGVIRIAHPERLKEYEMRVYDIRDLLLNTEDKYGVTRGRYGRRDYDYGATTTTITAVAGIAAEPSARTCWTVRMHCGC